MPRDQVEDYEAAIERILDRQAAKEAAKEAANAPPPPKPPNRIAHGIAGWWVILFIAGTLFTVLFQPEGFFPVFFLAAVVTMPVAVICAVIVRRPSTVRHYWGGHRLWRV